MALLFLFLYQHIRSYYNMDLTTPVAQVTVKIDFPKRDEEVTNIQLVELISGKWYVLRKDATSKTLTTRNGAISVTYTRGLYAIDCDAFRIVLYELIKELIAGGKKFFRRDIVEYRVISAYRTKTENSFTAGIQGWTPETDRLKFKKPASIV
jgi:hypothetical protein